MTDAFPRKLWTPLLLGSYAALIGLLPDGASRAAAAAPALGLAFAWWILSGGPNHWVVAFFCAAVLLPPLPIALGDSGPHPALAPAGLGLIAGMLRLPEWRVLEGAAGRALLAFLGVLLLSLPLAALYSGVEVALGSLARVMLFAISVYVFFYVTSGPWNPAGTSAALRVLFLAASLSALFACVDFYFQFPAPAGFGPQFVWLDSGVFRRAQGIFYEASTLGNFCAFFLAMIATALARPAASPVPRGWLLAAAAVFGAALVLSFSRSSLLNVLAGVTALLWLQRDRLPVRRLALLFPFAVASGGGALHYFLPEFTNLYLSRLSNSATYFFSATESVLAGRLSSWSALTAFLSERPLHAILGIGYKTLPYSRFTGERIVGDNMYLTILVETGVIGLAVFLALNAAILAAAYRAARRQDSRASFFGTWVFCFWTGQMFQMLSGDLFTFWRVLPFYFWALAVAIRAADEHPLPRSI